MRQGSREQFKYWQNNVSPSHTASSASRERPQRYEFAPYTLTHMLFGFLKIERQRGRADGVNKVPSLDAVDGAVDRHGAPVVALLVRLERLRRPARPRFKPERLHACHAAGCSLFAARPAQTLLLRYSVLTANGMLHTTVKTLIASARPYRQD